MLWWQTSVAGRVVLAVGSVPIGNDCATFRNEVIEPSGVNRRFAAISYGSADRRSEDMATEKAQTVWAATYDLLRALGVDHGLW
jgi:hypothetical protein